MSKPHILVCPDGSVRGRLSHNGYGYVGIMHPPISDGGDYDVTIQPAGSRLLVVLLPLGQAAYLWRGYTGAELSWTLEDNALINRTIEAVGGRMYKTYRIYERAMG